MSRRALFSSEVNRVDCCLTWMRHDVQVRCDTANAFVGSRATVSFTGRDLVSFKMQVLSDDVSKIYFGLTSNKATSQRPGDRFVLRVSSQWCV